MSIYTEYLKHKIGYEKRRHSVNKKHSAIIYISEQDITTPIETDHRSLGQVAALNTHTTNPRSDQFSSKELHHESKKALQRLQQFLKKPV